jgi:dihydrodipicolinate synthase/N-acetylneuraminate lyase
VNTQLPNEVNPMRTQNHNVNMIEGIVPPMLTPMLDRDTLDIAGLERLVEHIIAGGVHGLFILGTTGEAPSLSYKLRRELIERVCRLVAGRVPVLAGVTDTSFVESLAMAGYAADHGVDAVVLAPPYYFPAGQPELGEYLHHLVDACPLPVFLYNMPSMTKLVIEPETVRHLTGLENIIGIKDSSGDLAYFRELLALARDQRPDWRILIGPEALLAEATAAGGHGGVSGGANLHPRLFVELYDAVRQGDALRSSQLQQQVLALGRIYTVGNYSSAIIKGLKCSLMLLGICNDFMAEPFHRFRQSERNRVQALLEEMGLRSATCMSQQVLNCSVRPAAGRGCD